jgi:hypothetical protein
MYDSEERLFALVGSSSAYTWREDSDKPHDHLATPIDWEILTKYYDGGSTADEKHWDMLTVLGKRMDAGVIKIYPTAGYIDDPERAEMTYSMTAGKENVGRVGDGLFMRLRMRHNEYNEPVRLFGIELPFSVYGRR